MAKLYIGKKQVVGGGSSGGSIKANVELPITEVPTDNLLSIELPCLTNKYKDQEVEPDWSPDNYTITKAVHTKFGFRANDDTSTTMVYWFEDPRWEIVKQPITTALAGQVPSEYLNLFNSLVNGYYEYTTGSLNDIFAALQTAGDTQMLSDAQWLQQNGQDMYFVVDNEIYLASLAEFTAFYPAQSWMFPNIKDLLDYIDGKIEFKQIKLLCIFNNTNNNFPFECEYLVLPLEKEEQLGIGMNALQNSQDPLSAIESLEWTDNSVIFNGGKGEHTFEGLFGSRLTQILPLVRDYYKSNFEMTVGTVSPEPLTNLKINGKYYSISANSGNNNTEELSELEIRRLLRTEYTIDTQITGEVSFSNLHISGDTAIWSNETAIVNLSIDYKIGLDINVIGADFEVEYLPLDETRNETYIITLSNAFDNVSIIFDTWELSQTEVI